MSTTDPRPGTALTLDGPRRAEAYCGVHADNADLTPGQEPDAVELPINGVLDLHLFRPADVGDLVPEYLAECRKRGILQVRIIHGKGTGALRESVHAILRRMPEVAAFGLAAENAGSWGATLVTLRR
jgi:dsDNA-specific endonuclease/ATPase MutS2